MCRTEQLKWYDRKEQLNWYDRIEQLKWYDWTEQLKLYDRIEYDIRSAPTYYMVGQNYLCEAKGEN